MTTTDIEVRGGGALAVGAEQTAWTEQQLAVLRSAGVSEEVTPAELDAFLHECQRTRLDPFSKQIYLIGRYDNQLKRKVFRSQTGIDGYRVVAHRVARDDRTELEYEDTVWCGPDGAWRDVWLGQNPPAAAKVVVYKGGKRYSAVATLEEYAARYPDGNPYPMWRRMPANQLEKCAEAKALRRAFPNDLGGIYTAEEMEQADARGEQPSPQVQRERPQQPRTDEWSTPAPQPGPVQDGGEIADAEIVKETPAEMPPEAPKASKALLKTVNIEVTKRVGNKDEDRLGLIADIVGRPIASSSELTVSEARTVLAALAKADEQNAQPATPPEGWTAEQSDQLAADFLAELQGSTNDAARVEIAGRIAKAVKAGKLTPADRETLLAAYTGRQSAGAPA